MILDARAGDVPDLPEYDIVIVGAGPAGITLACELDGANLRIALLESGGEEFDPDTQELYDGHVTGLEETDLMSSRLRFLGGTSNHWGGHCLPLDAIDFDRAPLSGLSGWPFGRAALEDAYRRAHVYCDLGEDAYSPAAIADDGRSGLLLENDATVETVVVRQSAPTRFGPKYLARLTASKNVDLWLWANLVGIDIDEGGVAGAVETRTLSGRARRFAARTVVLASGGIENARLLLANNALGGRSYGDAGGLLGKCFMDHVVGGAAFLWLREPQVDKVYWNGHVATTDGKPMRAVWRLRDDVLQREGLANSHYDLIPFFAPEAMERTRAVRQGWRGAKDIAKWGLGRAPHDFSFSESYCMAVANADMMALDALGLVQREGAVSRLLLRYEAEQQPNRENFVDLLAETDELGMPRARLNWSPGEADRDSIVASAMLIGAACGRADLGRVELEDHFDLRYWDASTAWHHMGTTRMAQSPTGGVVDSDCLLHGTRNLYVAGSSVMPSGGRANPTLTIVALSIRLADHLKARSGT
ncbi:GMC oxidoreductase [Tropicimonas sp.]|uniref:GMC oxidoreductase n=1 Tax=Tropicimonas sp. TaxID=2067044 RepID=UPI003A8861B7